MDAAYPVTHSDPVEAPFAGDRPVSNREYHRVALIEVNYFHARLRPWTLLGKHELTTLKIVARPGQQDRGLQRKDVLAVDILMKTVVIVLTIPQQQGRRSWLPCGVADGEEIGKRQRITYANA